jgi:D-alanyl-D-alanine dipeptidase
MPTEFDEFTEKAHRKFMDLPLEAIENRELLEKVMEMHGFIGLDSEWWHFDFAGWENYPPLEIDL